MVKTFILIINCSIFIYYLNGQMFPNLQQLSSIYIPSETYGNAFKIRTNQLYIVRIAITRIDIWWRNNLTFIQILQPGQGIFALINDNFQDFSFTPNNHNRIGVLFARDFKLYDIDTQSVVISYSNIKTQDFKKAYLTQSQISFLYADQTFQRLDFNTQSSLNQFTSAFTNLPFVQVCQNSQLDLNLIFWTNENQVVIYKCQINTGNSQQQCTIKHQIAADGIATKSIDRIMFTNDCSKIYIQDDSNKVPIIYNYADDSTTQYQDLGVVLLFSSFNYGPSNIYSLFVISNGTILIYSDTTTVIHSYQISYDISTNFFDIDIYDDSIYISFQEQIKVIKFACTALTYKSDINQCSPCEPLCLICNNIDGICQVCLNSSYVPVNGICKFTYQSYSSGSMFQIQHYIANFIESSFQLSKKIIQTFLIVLKLNPFGFIYLYFLNFWQITCSYILLNINIPRYLKRTLYLIHDLSDKPILSLISDTLSINSKIQIVLSYNLKQKITTPIRLVYGISSKFTYYNLQQLVLIGFHFLILLILYICKKCISSLDQWFYKKIILNYLKTAFRQISTVIFSFSFGILVIISQSYQDRFKQKINMVIIYLFLIISFCLPFLIVSSFYNRTYFRQKNSFKNHKKQEKKVKKQKRQSTRIKKIVIEEKNQSNQIIIKKNKKIRRKKQQMTKKINNIFSEKAQLFYLVSCIVIVPVFISLSIHNKWFMIAFFSFTFILYIFGIYSAYLQSNYSVTKIMFAIYYVVFHLSFMTMWLLDSHTTISDQYLHLILIHISSTICFITLGIGAVHITFFFLFQVIKLVIKSMINLFTKRNKVQNYSSNERNKEYKNHQIIVLKIHKKQRDSKIIKLRNSIHQKRQSLRNQPIHIAKNRISIKGKQHFQQIKNERNNQPLMNSISQIQVVLPKSKFIPKLRQSLNLTKDLKQNVEINLELKRQRNSQNISNKLNNKQNNNIGLKDKDKDQPPLAIDNLQKIQEE